MSIRSQNKKVNVNFQRKLSTHSFHETEFHEISFNKYLEKHSKTCLPNLSIHGLYSIISHRQYSISQYSCLFYHYINCISTSIVLFNNSSREASKTCYTSYQIFQFTNYPTISIFNFDSANG